MQKLILAALLAAAFASGTAIAADSPEKVIPAVVLAGSARTEAEVVAIDLASRKVSLKDEDGKVSEIVVGDKVKNLAQVKVGDRVVLEYDRALSLKLKKGPGLRVTTEKVDSASAAPGQMPAAAAGREVNFVADVINIDAKKHQITIKGAKGKTFDLSIKDPEVFSQIALGDQVEGTYLQVLSVRVLPPKK